MKKINYLIYIVTIIGTIYTILFTDNNLVSYLKDISLMIVMVLPLIISKLFKIKVKDNLVFIYSIFVFSAGFLGVTLRLYGVIPGFDKLNHTLSGVLSSFVGLLLLNLINKYKSQERLFNIFYMIIFSLAVAALWEMFEYTCNILFGGDAQMVAKTGVDDTMQDMIVAFIGSIITSLIYYFKYNSSLFIFKNAIKKVV
jgi:uncharacterized membrane protein YjdF